eukprot:4218958-Ditylum_brightwellii.AAC.1
MKLHQDNLDYTKHGVYTFGEYVLGHDEPTPSNTQEVRALDYIYICPTSNMLGDNIPKWLKIKNHTGVTLFDSSWTAGVDFNEEQFDNDNYSMSSNESEESEGEYDKIDKNELAEMLQEAPVQTAGVENTDNTGVHEVEENEEEEQSLSNDSNEEGDENTQQQDDDPSSTINCH